MESDNNQPSTSGTRETVNSENESSENEDSADESNDPSVNVNMTLTDDYENELENDLEKEIKKKGPKERKYISKIPSHLKGLMGEANLRFARGEYETAEKMCYEVIRQEPRAYEPYVTLSQLHENTHVEKSIQYLTIAALLNRSNIDHWLRLSQHYIERKNFKAAVRCYTRAICIEPTNCELHEKRIQLLEALNDRKFALRCKAKVLQILDKNDYLAIMEKAKELAHIYYKDNEYDKALEIIQIPIKKCTAHITLEIVNIYLELLLLKQEYAQCLDVFLQFCNIETEVLINDENKINILSYNIPNDIQIDLRIKFIVCVIKLGAFDLIDLLLHPLLSDEENVERIGDLYLDVAEALMSMERYTDALKLLVPLIKSVNFSLAAVWLKYAECLMHSGMIEQAIDAYTNVVHLAPQHNDVRYPLSELLLKERRIKEALDVLHQDPNALEVDVGLLIKRMNILRNLNRIEEYFESVNFLLKRHCIIVTDESELHILFHQTRVNQKIQRLNQLRDLRSENHVVLNITSLHEPSVEEEYEIYKEMLKFCYKNGYHKQLKKFAYYGIGSGRFKAYVNDIMVAALYGCVCTRDNKNAYPILRDIIVRRNKTNNLIWNLFNLSSHVMKPRFLMRQAKFHDQDFIKILEAVNAHSAGSYKMATICLMPLLKSKPTPFIYFLLGIVFLQISFQKYRDIRKKITQCAYGLFANYGKTRGKAANQEVLYNLGRLYHQYGMLEIATFYYKKVFEYEDPLILEYPELDLKREAAFNLMMIYKVSGNYINAKLLMRKYLTV